MQFSNRKYFVNNRDCGKHSSISNLWTVNSRPNYIRKKIFMRYNKDRLERSLCNFEWDNNTIAYIVLCNVKLIGKHNGRTIKQYNRDLIFWTMWMVPIYFLCFLHFLEYSRLC